MLDCLLASKTLTKILLFLMVNRKCYGLQLSRLLQSSLTPIQKALQKLEKGDVVVGYLQGKTKFYQFNPSFPLIEELEELLYKKLIYYSLPKKKNGFAASSKIAV